MNKSAAFTAGVVDALEKEAGIMNRLRRGARNVALAGALLGTGAGAHAVAPHVSALAKTPGVQQVLHGAGEMARGAKSTGSLIAAKAKPRAQSLAERLGQKIKNLPVPGAGGSGPLTAYR